MAGRKMLNIIVVLESSDQILLTTSCNYFMFLSISYKWSMDVSNMALYNIHILSLFFFSPRTYKPELYRGLCFHVYPAAGPKTAQTEMVYIQST